jgi:hypothetical protein
MSAQQQDGVATTNSAAGLADLHRALRREVNEQINVVNHDFGIAEPDMTDVICECVHPNCTARIVMTMAGYELVRRFPNRFFVKAGHEVTEEERVVAESDGYVVIEVAGHAGLSAVGADRRRRTHSVEAGT